MPVAKKLPAAKSPTPKAKALGAVARQQLLLVNGLLDEVARNYVARLHRELAELLRFIDTVVAKEKQLKYIKVALGATFALLVLFALTTVTAIGRFVKVWSAANATMPNRPERTRSMVLESRWKEWRERTTIERREGTSRDVTTRWRARRQDGASTRPLRSRRGAQRRSRHTAPPR
jgi:hypothetical protein